MVLVLAVVWWGGQEAASGTVFRLKGTPTAPTAAGSANVGASGVSLEFERLNPGLYQVQAVVKGRPLPATLAWVAVVDPDHVPSLEAGDSANTRDSTHQAAVLRTSVQVQLPPEVAPASIESVTVSDAAGCRWLVTQENRNASQPVSLGTGE